MTHNLLGYNNAEAQRGELVASRRAYCSQSRIPTLAYDVRRS